MADNFQVTAGSGITVATKDASGVHHPKQLIEIDVSGTPTLVSSSNPMPISDGGGSITVDGTVAVSGGSGTFISNLSQYGGTNVGSGNALHVQAGTGATFSAAQSGSWTVSLNAGSNNIGDVDVLTLPGTTTSDITATKTAAESIGNIVQTEDNAHSSGHKGVMSLAVRQDALSSLVGTDGDYIPLTTDESGRLNVSAGKVTTASVTPTISTTQYTSGDALGGKMTFTGVARVSGGSGRIKSVIVVDQDKESAPIDLVLFESDPSGTTFTDNAALDIADADMGKIIGKVSVIDYANLNDNSFSGTHNLDIPFKLASGTSLYGVLAVRSAPTYTATSDIIVKLVIDQD